MPFYARRSSIALFLASRFPAGAASLTASFAAIPQGSNVVLTVAGPVDWVHWGLYTETSLDRKAGVAPLISDFTLLDATNGFAYVYEFADNYNGYTWSDGTPTAAVTNTTTGVWAYGVPAAGSGFLITAPADTTLRTLSVYVGAFAAAGKFEASLSDNSGSLCQLFYQPIEWRIQSLFDHLRRPICRTDVDRQMGLVT